MKTHTSSFKETIKELGRQIDGKIYYYPNYNIITENGDTILTETDLEILSEQIDKDNVVEIDSSLIYSMNIKQNGQLLQSLMKEFDFEAKQDFNIGSVLNPQFGLLIDEENRTYEYLDYGNYIIYSKEFNLDSETWNYVCYDFMLYSMVKYLPLKNITYPITIRNFIKAIADRIGVDFVNINDNFVNYDQLINEELFKNKGYTYRDILDKLSQITASNIIINKDDNLEIKYVTNTIGKNLLNIQTIVKGRVDNGNVSYQSATTDLTLNNDSFTFTTDANWRGVVTDFIEVEPLTFYIVSYTSNTVTKYFDCYDENKAWLGRVNLTSYSSNWLKYKTLANTKYIRFSWQLNPKGTITISYPQIEKGEQVTGYEHYGLDTLNEEYLKDMNVAFGETFGPVNKITLQDTDNELEYYAEDSVSIKQNEKTQINITDNELVFNGEEQTICNNILTKLDGLYYSINDFTTTGLCYYDYLDLFIVEAKENTYQCLLLNNELTFNQGIEESIFTEKLEQTETSANNYETSIISNKQVQFKINQQEGKIESKVEKDGVISAINQSAEEIKIQANKLSFEGATIDMTADDITIRGENLEIDSDGMITLTDNSASNSLDKEELHSAYIIKSSDSVIRGVRHESLDFVNRIVGNGHRTEVEMNWDDGEYTGGGISGIMEAVYSQPRITLYGQTLDYDPTTGTGSYEALDMSITGGIMYSVITGQTTRSPLILTTGGNIVIENNLTCKNVYYSGSLIPVSSSKEEKKKNFENLKNAKQILNSTDIYKYNMANEKDTDKKHIGFVIGDKFNYSKEITTEDNENVNLYSMVSVLWQVVKEQQEEINELKEVIKNGKY